MYVHVSPPIYTPPVYSPAGCSIGMENNAAKTLIATVNTPVKIAGTTAPGPINNLFDLASTNKMIYTGAPTLSFFVAVSVSLIAHVTNKKISPVIVKNGLTPQNVGVATFVQSVETARECTSTFSTVFLNTNDFIEIWVENRTDITDVTVIDLAASVIQLTN